MSFRIDRKLWFLSPLLVAASFLVWRKIVTNNDRRIAQLLLLPQPGDIYEMATENSQYTLLRVSRIQGDSVFVNINEFETDKKKGLSQLKEKPFAKEEIAFTRQTLRVMQKEGKILDVER
ncbi:hypothetical protein [Niastella populi]|uniref:Uncharacterized protein n=1 Tax=Niastella populi TaxID=550983 RepID=A0A1V9GA63_9BACT|nr:hypothetical protein [Niastella populi]OQP67561.1 hypothetical protein A4R26_12145 [Niastella populi]